MTNHKGKILVCEDNAALAGVISFNLVRAGFEVKAYTNGVAALEALQREDFDLILSDQQMPMMTGIQLCENAREMPRYRDTPFILLTAKCMEINFGTLPKKLEITAALPKPFSPTELVTCIEDALTMRVH
jgi:CheY-like chemotaxis protein